MSTAETKRREVCIMQLQSAIDWSLMWGNLHNVILSGGARSAWYLVIHDTIPTNMRLHRIRLKGTEKCTQCGRRDTVLHRLTECGLRQEIWEWIRTRIAGIQRTDPKRIPNEWLLRLCVKLWPWHRQEATLWFLVSMVFFNVVLVLDCTEFNRRKRWKIYQDKKRMQLAANYLEVF